MKLKDVVYLIDDRTITKTRILGIQDKLEKDNDGKEVTVKYYLVQGEKAGYGSGDRDGWVGKSDLYASLEEAQRTIKERIQAEIIEEISKITIVDVLGGRQ